MTVVIIEVVSYERPPLKVVRGKPSLSSTTELLKISRRGRFYCQFYYITAVVEYLKPNKDSKFGDLRLEHLTECEQVSRTRFDRIKS